MSRPSKALATLQANGLMSRAAEMEQGHDTATQFIFDELSRAAAIVERTRILAQMLGVETEFAAQLKERIPR